MRLQLRLLFFSFFILCLSVAPNATGAIPDPSADLILHLNETTGTSFADASGKGNTGSCSGNTCPALGVRGEFGGGARFDGVNDEIFVNVDVSESSFTSSLWFNTTRSDTGIFSVVDIPSGGHDRHIFLSGGSLCVRTWSDETVCGAPGLADGKWHHVAHVFGGAAGGQDVYVDGQLAVSGSKAGSDFNWQTAVRVGVSADSFNPFYLGLIDEVTVFQRDLTPLEIRNLFTRGAFRQNIAVDPAAGFVVYTATTASCLNERPFLQPLVNGRPSGAAKQLVACTAMPDDVLGLDLLQDGTTNRYWLSFAGSQTTDSRYLMQFDANGAILLAPKAVVTGAQAGYMVSGTALQRASTSVIRMWFIGSKGYLCRATISAGTATTLGLKKVALISYGWTSLQATQGVAANLVSLEAPLLMFRAFGMDAFGNPSGASWRLSPRTDLGHRWGALAADAGMALSDVRYKVDQLYVQPLRAGKPSLTPKVVANGTEMGSADVSGLNSSGLRLVVYRSAKGILVQKITATGDRVGNPVKII